MSEAVPSVKRPLAGPSRLIRRLGLGLGAALLVLLVLLSVAWLNRRAAARELLIGWLEKKGIDADLRIDRVELDGLTARIRVGDPADPDVTVERVEMDYVLGAPWSKAGLGVTPGRIRLVRPVVRARFHDGTLSFGSLDPLIKEFTRRPPRPDTRGPLVLIEQGRARLDSDYGRATADVDARIDNGKLMRLRALVPPTALKHGGMETDGLTAVVDLTTTGDRLAGRIGLAADRARLSGFAGEALRGEIVADLPYPDLKTHRGDGRAVLRLTVVGDRLALGGAAARGATATAAFAGSVTGWIDAFRIDGQGDAALTAASLSGSGARASSLKLRLEPGQTSLSRNGQGIVWRREGAATASLATGSAPGLTGRDIALRSAALTMGGRGAAMEASGPVSINAGQVSAGDLSLIAARLNADLDLVSDGGLRLDAAGSLTAARGAWPLFGPPARDDIPELAAMKTALAGFAVDVPVFRFGLSASGTRLALERPATLRPVNGGVLTVRPVARPVFEALADHVGGGALTIVSSRGAGLPEAAVAVPAWRLTPTGFTATLDGRAALDFGLARGLTLRTRGELASAGGRLTFMANGCAPVTVERLELDENDVTDLSGDFCPAGRPLVSVAGGAWRAEGTLRDVAASAPFLALDFRQAEGALTATGGPRGLGLEARITRAAVVDATTPHRFNPLTAHGTARLASEDWSGAFDLSRNDVTLARLTLAHDGRTGAGGIAIDAPAIVFAPAALQPADLSPMIADLVQSPATGSAAFRGRVDWLKDQDGSSGGRLTIPALDFTSPAGPVKGLKGVIDFTSLAPLTTAPDQHLTADEVTTIAPLTDVEVAFALDKAAVTVSGGRLSAAGGVVSLEPFTLPLDRAQPWTGVIALEKVQLGELIAGSGFGDKVQLDAVVSGRLPFSSDPTLGWRIAGGSLQAVRPGRLSIQREALSGLQAGGGGDGVPPNTVQDLAYQAMENLAFDTLSADVNSLDQGRLGVLFHIKGRHDPPERQELRLSLSELISRKFLNRPLPLPSDTGIDLTLDTTLNLNQLIADLIALNRARAGHPDAPEPASPSGP